MSIHHSHCSLGQVPRPSGRPQRLGRCPSWQCGAGPSSGVPSLQETHQRTHQEHKQGAHTSSLFLRHDITSQVMSQPSVVTARLTEAGVQPQALLTVLRQKAVITHAPHAALESPPLPAGPDETRPVWCSRQLGCCTAGHPLGCV